MKLKLMSAVLAIAFILSGLSAGAVSASTTLPSIHVGDIQASYAALATGGYVVSAKVLVHDMEHLAVPGAVVSLTWTTPKGVQFIQQAITDSKGLASFQYKTLRAGVYTVSVSGLQKSGTIYNPKLNEKGSAAVEIPSALPVRSVTE